MTVKVVAPATSLGLRWYAGELVTALQQQGCAAELATRTLRPRMAHLQLGNSSRSLLPAALLAPEPLVLTVHDAIPRDPRLRPAWRRLAPAVLRRHRVVVHSEYAAGLLRELDVKAAITVVPLAAAERRVASGDIAAFRKAVSPEGLPVVLSAGVLKRAKGVLEVLSCAPSFPDLVFAFVGRPADDETRAALETAPSNVIVRTGLSDEEFQVALGAADVLLNLRRDWVGEASAPVAQAHGLGTPVVGYDAGGLADYCGSEDLLLPPGTPAVEVLRLVRARLAEGVPRLPLEAAQVTTWSTSARRYQEIYDDLGWLDLRGAR